MLIFNKHFCIVKILTSAETEGTWVINFLRTKTLKVKAVLSHFFPLWFLGFLSYLEVFLSLMIIFYYLVFPMAFTIRYLPHLGFNCEIPMKLYYFLHFIQRIIFSTHF